MALGRQILAVFTVVYFFFPQPQLDKFFFQKIGCLVRTPRARTLRKQKRKKPEKRPSSNTKQAKAQFLVFGLPWKSVYAYARTYARANACVRTRYFPVEPLKLFFNRLGCFGTSLSHILKQKLKLPSKNFVNFSLGGTAV